MTPPSPADRPIVVGVESPAHCRLPLAWAADEAERRHLPLLVVHARPQPGGTEGLLDEAVRFVRSRRPGLPVSGIATEDEPARALLERGANASMIVLGTRFRTARQELFTATAVALPVTAHAHCPVVVVREGEHVSQDPPYLVVGVDGSTAAQAAVDFAFEEAGLRGARLRALSVWQPPHLGVLDEAAALGECRATLYEAVAGRRQDHPGVDLHHEVMTGHPVEVLVRESRHALALVTGARGLGGFSGMLLGSVSQGAVHHAQCPVITVPRPQAPPGPGAAA